MSDNGAALYRQHVVPLHDLREHEPTGCWCGPELDADGVVTHHPMALHALREHEPTLACWCGPVSPA
jgi:hypothetical protein